MQPIPNDTFRALCLLIARGDFTMNAKMKATYALTEEQKHTLNLLLKLAKTKLFTEVKLIQ